MQKKVWPPKRIELAEQDAVVALGEHVDAVLEAVGYPGALVTDRSLIGDFMEVPVEAEREAAYLAGVAERLGLDAVASGDRIVDLARRVMLGEP
jgi:hypothetical protein